jgi:hypothetical protein
MRRVAPWARAADCLYSREAATPCRRVTRCPRLLQHLGGIGLPVAIPGVLEGVPGSGCRKVNDGESVGGAHEEGNDRDSLEEENDAGTREKVNAAGSRVEIGLYETTVERGSGLVHEEGSGWAGSGLVAAATRAGAARIWKSRCSRQPFPLAGWTPCRATVAAEPVH